MSTVRKRKSGSASGALVEASSTGGTAGANGVPAPPSTSTANTSMFNRSEFRKTLIQSVIRAAIMYGTMKYFMSQNKKDEEYKNNPQLRLDEQQQAAQKRANKLVRSNLWGKDTRYDVRIFTSLENSLSSNEAKLLQPAYMEKDLVYTLDQSNYRGDNITLDVPTQVSNHNQSWYAHIFVSKASKWNDDVIHPTHLMYRAYDLISWNKGPIVEEGTSLLGGDKEDEEKLKEKAEQMKKAAEEEGDSIKKKDIIFQYSKPMVTVALVTDLSPFSKDATPPTISHAYIPADDVAGFPTYYPPLFVNEFWLLGDTLVPMNSSVDTIRLEVNLEPISMKKWAIQAQFDETMKMQMQYGASNAKEADKLKRMLIETNPYLLATTMIVSVAHSVLEALAFRNDISHWRSIKSMEGISVRSMGVKIVMEIIIFLYLFDNDTSWMIIVGNAIGIAIEVWKLMKAVEFKNFGSRRIFFGLIPWFETKDRASYSKETREHDETAMRYLSYAAYPLIVIYSIYSLVYEKHKSWYSWVLGSLVGAVYAFGFLLMVPAVYINYKLKSVAHLPMRALMYKALNTVIDDLFSFVIKMPWLHRLACFRDDVIFIVFMYQCYIYPVDKSRVNEFGQTFDEDGNEIVGKAEEDAAKEKAAAKNKNKKKKKNIIKTIKDGDGENSITSSIVDDNEDGDTAAGEEETSTSSTITDNNNKEDQATEVREKSADLKKKE